MHMEILLVLLVTANIASARSRHLRPGRANPSNICSDKDLAEWSQLMKESECGEPRDQFVEIPNPHGSHVSVTPQKVWVKRCNGLCETQNCIATSKRMRKIQVHYYDVKKRKETCETQEIEEHVSCGCGCQYQECNESEYFDDSTCRCVCKDEVERYKCENAKIFPDYRDVDIRCDC